MESPHDDGGPPPNRPELANSYLVIRHPRSPGRVVGHLIDPVQHTGEQHEKCGGTAPASPEITEGFLDHDLRYLA